MATRLGLELFDGIHRIATFVIPKETTKNPFCLGREGQVILPFEGVLPVHCVLVYKEGRLWAASASEKTPALAGADVIPTEWVEIDVRSSIKLGRVTVRPFLVHERGRVLTPSPPAVSSSVPTVIVHAPHPAVRERRRASTAVKLLCAALPFVALFLAIGR